MSTNLHHIRGHGSKAARRVIPQLFVIIVVMCCVPGVALAGNTGAVIRSLLLPGTGQAHQGHYTKATVFAGAAIISGAGLFVSQVQYNRAVDSFNSAQDSYNSAVADWQNGGVLSTTFLNADIAKMQNASGQADTDLKWRNFFLGTLIATYALNVVDILISKPHNPETAMRYTIEANPKRVLLVRTFGF